MAPRVKQQQLTSGELDVVFTSEERRRIVYDEIRLPRPQGGNMVYSAAEAVHVIDTIVAQNVVDNKNGRHLKRLVLTIVKQKMMDEKRVPVKRSQLNYIYKVAKDGMSPPIFWNNRGQPEIMPLEELRALFDAHAKREGSGWTVESTTNALLVKMKAKLEANGLDSSTMLPPYHQTIMSYHSALKYFDARPSLALVSRLNQYINQQLGRHNMKQHIFCNTLGWTLLLHASFFFLFSNHNTFYSVSDKTDQRTMMFTTSPLDITRATH
mmetsp:Transcript_27431/g.65962  ORF Transcript_27431/g.65962 Transcript_27431/m.65962 type:complete len:267 (-) Transcript_27431:179-979(-)